MILLKNLNTPKEIMDYKTFKKRFITSLFLIVTFVFFLIFYNLLPIFFTFIYLIILFEIYLYFNHKNKYLIYIYLLCSFISLQYFFFNVFNLYYFLYVIFIIILFDTSSYICGSIFGKTKMFPKISPNKTYIGFLFGYIITLLLIYPYCKFYFEYNIMKFILLSSLLVFLTFIGDIIESFLKRKSNIKDSSNLLPGHGGFFDRFDSFLFVFMALPFIENIF